MKIKVILIILLIFSINLFFIIFSHISLHKQYNQFKLLNYHLLHLKSNLSYAHLWSEEYIIGDKSIDLQRDIYSKLNAPTLHLFFKGINEITDDTTIILSSKKLYSLYNKFYSLTKKRIFDNNANIAGSDYDQLYDKEYTILTNEIDSLISYISAKENYELEKNTYYFFMIVILFIVLNFLLFYIIYFVYKRNEKNQQLLYEQSKLASMGEMIGNIAHQWRQPLSIISTSATGMMLQKEVHKLKEDDFIKYCNSINDNAQYLSQTIDDFRDFIKGDKRKVDFLLQNNIESFVKLIESSLKNHDIQLIANFEDRVQCQSYPNELIQCYMNLYNNTKDAFNENNIKKRYFFISIYKKEDKVIIETKDNAGGIPKDVIDKIFEPYFTTKHQSIGTGLGLSMTYNIVTNSFNGTINVKNETFTFKEKKYTGAKFTIVLPNYCA